MKDVIAGLHPLERAVLPLLLRYSSVDDLAARSGLQQVEVLRALQWSSGKRLCTLTEKELEVAELDYNGKAYSKNLLPELRFLKAAGKGKISLQHLRREALLSDEELGISIGILKKDGLISVAKGKELEFEITTKGREKLSKGFAEQLLLQKLEIPKQTGDFSKEEKAALNNLAGRKAIVRISRKKEIAASLTKLGQEIAKDSGLKEKVVDALTSQMLKDGSWSKANFRSYDIAAQVPRVFFGKKQPYRRFLEEVRSKLVAMGFKEMAGPVVEAEFWNMDALFMPQFHSARDIHDAYYVREPKFADDLPMELVKKVKLAHEKGIPGSKGWRYGFDIKKTSRLILRSHDTAISPRTLSSKDLEVPGKYFQISRCFRYDVIDATHNADFDQIGGFVVDDNLNLRHLFGLLRLFAREFCQTDKIRVVPSYFPFTEPSAALYARHPDMGWIELAGAGIFRPEMTVPLGVNKPVIAWGIGLGRVAMFRLGLKDIRQLYSHDIAYLRSAKVI